MYIINPYVLEFNLFAQSFNHSCSPEGMPHSCYPTQIHGVLLARRQEEVPLKKRKQLNAWYVISAARGLPANTMKTGDVIWWREAAWDHGSCPSLCISAWLHRLLFCVGSNHFKMLFGFSFGILRSTLPIINLGMQKTGFGLVVTYLSVPVNNSGMRPHEIHRYLD